MNKISDNRRYYIFIETYSKSLLKCLLLFHRKLATQKMKSVLFEFGNILWNFYWLFFNHSSVIVLNMEYVANLYIEYITQSINENFREVMKNTQFEKIAKIFCYKHVLEKYGYCMKSLPYNPLQYNILYIIKNRIDLYFLKHMNTLVENSDYFATFLMFLHEKYTKYSIGDYSHFELDNLLNSVQDRLNAG